jgi:hypothetical protein
MLYVSGDYHPSDKQIPWSIALVERRYWGLPWWARKFVLIGHSGVLKKGSQYFIDGDRSGYRIAKFLPYVDFHCGNRTRLLSEADLETRLLKDGPPKSGDRIIGRTLRRFGVGDWRPALGVTVRITGPEGTISTVTDQQGIYDLVGLPPGHYSVRADAEDDADTFPRENYERVEGELRSGDIWGRDILVK